ncbi:class II SORL domain-containing protein [Kosmotoga olearia]|jgi:superoxide reductase|uniref:Desulfoferrodoxin ferrous iron-binding region n=1 Tax=Kosmotoga olearia (strain ATCC BAA-1733 / DSM 21960 / TBF 19.5.1) TaxID=521045 RepID=C5CIN3_KOSOT|nr:class II SORL domain-containing protein [Kosmotoga olearia]ACR80816.1 Desulfoferrodoxin ferrous iron-binding region [Kosmotoga olearia TBF 19.5.1]
MKIGEFVKTADWKNEKHAPLIEAPEQVETAKAFTVELSVGKEIPHPNTVEHHIKWMDLYVKYDDSQFLVHLGHIELTPVLSEPKATLTIKLEKSGTLIATSYCNLHGLWESSKKIEVK